MRIKVTGQKRLRVIGRDLPKAVDGLVAGPGDDEWIRKILEYESTKGSSTGGPLSNFGYNNWQKFGHTNPPSTIEEAISYFNQDFLPKVQQYPMGLRERMGDYIYNTGRNPNDLLLYNAGKITLDQLNSPNVFTNEWNQYGPEIQKMYSDPNFINKLDKSKDDVYRTTKQINGQPNPAYLSSWIGRVNMWGPYSAPAADNQLSSTDVVPPQNIPAKTTSVGSTMDQTGYTGNSTVTSPSTPVNTGNFNVYGPQGEILREMDASGKMVKDFYPNGFPGDVAHQELLNNQGIQSTSGAQSFPSTFGSIGKPNNYTAPKFPSFQESIAQSKPGACPDGQQKNPLTGLCEPKPSFGVPDSPQIKTNLGQGFIRNPETNTYGKPKMFGDPSKTQQGTTKTKTRTYREYDSTIPAMLTAGMGFMNNLLQNTRNYNDDVEYAKKLGQTNASEPTVRNVYSRGRHVLNVPLGADYAPNMMTPVQFAGRPVSEFTGFPGYGRNIFASKDGGLFKAADGTAFTESLGLPTLVENPNDYARAPLPEMKGPEIPVSAAPEPASTPSPDAQVNMDMAFAMPLKNIKLTSGFGNRKAPIKGASTNHNGIDLAASVNTPVYSPMDGIIEKIYYNDKGGKQLIIRHSDGSRSGFAHLNDYEVSIGDRVTKGQRVALSGNTGNSSGPHLHFTFRNSDGELVDPYDYFNMGGTNKPMNGISNLDHNNPGNIHIGDFAKGYGAVAGRKDGNGRVAVFPNMEAGMTAMQDLIFGSGYNNLSISQARNKWVNGDISTPSTSTNYIVNAMGGDFRLNNLTSAQRKKLISEFIKWEDRGVYSNLKSKGLVFKEGGEYELDDDEINYILANGGEIEYL